MVRKIKQLNTYKNIFKKKKLIKKEIKNIIIKSIVQNKNVKPIIKSVIMQKININYYHIRSSWIKKNCLLSGRYNSINSKYRLCRQFLKFYLLTGKLQAVTTRSW
jgi:ribosomal protein S14